MSSVGDGLDCSVTEEDWQRGQSYSARWHSLGASRVQRPTATEAARSEKYWQARRLLHRLLSGAISHGPPPETENPVEQGSPLLIDEGGSDFKTPKSLVLQTKTTMKMTLPRFLG
ncbi:uncharacterized protein LOC144038774 [Vanacampus margaritifer]